MTAAKHGGVILNHTSFSGFEKNGAKITGVHCKDELGGSSFQIKAKSVVNATGPYSDIIRKMDDASARDLCVPSAGVHAIFPDYVCPGDFGLLIPKTSDGGWGVVVVVLVLVVMMIMMMMTMMMMLIIIMCTCASHSCAGRVLFILPWEVNHFPAKKFAREKKLQRGLVCLTRVIQGSVVIGTTDRTAELQVTCDV